MSQTSLNAHWAFFSAPEQNDLLTAIKVREAEDRMLREAREDIRSALRAGFAAWQNIITKQNLFTRDFNRLATDPSPLQPRFRMQGSFAYHTANDPAQTPPQQIDLDDGMYMPTEFISAQSGHQPILASKGYFQIVEAILEPLCKRKGWTLRKDKPSCVRVELSDRCHIDIPLYAIPEKEFKKLTETVAFADSIAADAALKGEELVEAFYRALREDQIMLAHRDNGWQQSDPRKIEDWFQKAVKLHGPVLRRVCRYLKAWRDHHWKKQSLSSLGIMACVVSIFDRLNVELSEARDDVALLTVTEHLSAAFSKRIANPVLPHADVDLDRDWTPEDRQSFMSKAQDLHQRIDNALNGTDSPQHSLSELRACFGPRVTSDVSVIRKESRETEVKSFPAVRVPPPVVRRTTSG